jgi:hypothetical protein
MIVHLHLHCHYIISLLRSCSYVLQILRCVSAGAGVGVNAGDEPNSAGFHLLQLLLMTLDYIHMVVTVYDSLYRYVLSLQQPSSRHECFPFRWLFVLLTQRNVPAGTGAKAAAGAEPNWAGPHLRVPEVRRASSGSPGGAAAAEAAAAGAGVSTPVQAMSGSAMR